MNIPHLRQWGVASLCLLGSLLPAPLVHAAVATLQASGDVSLIAGVPELNHGAATSLWVQENQQVTLIRFDLGSHSIGEMTSATLGLYLEGFAGAGDNMVVWVRTMAPLNRNWVEGTGGGYPNGVAQPGSSTWNWRFHNTTTWSDDIKGAQGNPRITLGSFTFSRTGDAAGYRELTITDEAILAQWVEAGQVDLLITGTLTGGSGALRSTFTSREGLLEQRPYLSVNFEPIPEGRTTAMIGLGLATLWGVCRHRGRKA